MLGFFPLMFNDELLYSVLARFHHRSGNDSYKNTMRDLFGKSTTSAITDFPGEIGTLCDYLESDLFNPSMIVNNHTLLPYFLPFIKENQGKRIVEQMTVGNSDSISLSLGLAASKVNKTDYFRYCLSCFNEEVSLYGEPYWHRTHQLPGVLVCPKHKEFLYISDVPFRNKQNKHSFFTLDESAIINGEKILVPDKYFSSFVFIAEQSYRLLNEEQLLIGIDNIQKFYLKKLHEKGYITSSKRIRMKELILSFLTLFEPGFLDSIDSSFSQDDEDTWFHKVLRKPRVSCHPLRHLLLLLFLKEEIPNKSEGNNLEYYPFGKGPWPCLNRAANHYKELIISDCIVTTDSKTKQPVGTFICNQCNFIYSRRGPDFVENDKFKIGRVKNFGETWLNKLNELNSFGEYSIRGISSILGVDSKTVQKYLGNNEIINEIEEKKEKSENENLGERYKKNFIILKINNPLFSRTELKRANPSIYSWLYRNERDWLLRNLPVCKKTNKSGIKIDWKKRDEEYSFLLIKEAVNILIEKPLIRVTKTRIAKKLDLQAKFEKYMDKLPLCKMILSEITETVEDFQIRRIRYIGEKFKKENKTFTKSSLIRGAGLKNNISEKVKNVIYDESRYL